MRKAVTLDEREWSPPLVSDARTVPPLACTVRTCGQPLERSGQAWTCINHHAFDIARSGYVNLLQPQDRRSAHAGDPPSAIEARHRLVLAGVGAGLRDAVVDLIAGLSFPERPVVVELGCGSGDLLGHLSERADTCAVGIDLAASAAARAARAFPSLTWVVANADRRLPLLDQRVHVAVSVHARRNPIECARVLDPDGRLVVAVPAADDLIELREAVFGRRVEHPRVERVIEEHQGVFHVEQRAAYREHRRLNLEQLDDVLTGTYRGERRAAAASRGALTPMAVTLASDILVLSPKRT